MSDQPTICAVCGGESANTRHVNRTYGKGEDILVVERVPVVSCSHCGETYLEADTLHELERIKANRRNATKRPVAIAQFG